MRTYWQAGVCVDGVCKCSTGGDTTAANVITHCLSDAIYYQAQYPDSTITIDEIREVCCGCHNDGKVLEKRARSSRWIKCPECRGKVATGKLDKITLRMPDAANRIRLIAG